MPLISPTFAIVPVWLASWLTPLWLVGVGSLVGLVILLLIWGIMFVVARKSAREIPSHLSGSVILAITVCVAIMASFGIAATFAVAKPWSILHSATRLPFSGARTLTAQIPPAGEGERREKVAVNFQGEEVQRFTISTTEPVLFADAESEDEAHAPAVTVEPSQDYIVQRREKGRLVFDGDFVPNFYFANLSNVAANVTINIETAPRYPEAAVIPISALCVIGLFGLYLLQAFFAPKVTAIALSTSKSELAQPLFYILTIVGSFLLILFIFIPYNTFGEDIKMLKDSGLTLIMILAIIQGVWAASNSVAEEIEGKTALTVLSKPISRVQFLIGKFAGIMWLVSLMFLIVGLVFLFVVAYKPIYDGREMGSGIPEWDIGHFEIVRTVPGLVLAFFETSVLVAISVAISTRLPLMANFIICFAIYVLGHLTPLIVQSNIDFAPVVFIGNFIATILPVLDHFNIQAAVSAGVQVPIAYLATAFLYSVLYTTVALLLALILFEDRDLA